MPSRTIKKRKMRFDRLAAAVFLLAIIIFLLYLFIQLLTTPSGKTEKPVASNEKPDSAVSTSTHLEFEKQFFKYEDIYSGYLILVNDNHMYSVPSEQESMASIDEVKNDYYSIKNVNMLMDTLALKNFNSMLSGFYQQYSDKSIMITEALVTAERQNVIYNQALENSMHMSKGGYSEHQTGLAVDLAICSESDGIYKYSATGNYTWFRDNCTQYGFIRRYPDSKTDKTGIINHEEHFRYVGIPHAYYMAENDLSLEEYLQELKKYSYGSKTLNVSCYSNEYEIYYIRAKYDMTDNVDVYVPRNNKYTISGNNIDGFIITVEK